MEVDLNATGNFIYLLRKILLNGYYMEIYACEIEEGYIQGGLKQNKRNNLQKEENL